MPAQRASLSSPETIRRLNIIAFVVRQRLPQLSRQNMREGFCLGLVEPFVSRPIYVVATILCRSNS
jgi:hypothetical protein